MGGHDIEQCAKDGLKSGGITFAGRMLAQRLQFVRAAIAHDPYGLPGQRRCRAQILRECEYGKIGDIVPALKIGCDQLFAAEAIQHGGIGRRLWFAQQIEQRIDIEQCQHVRRRNATRRHRAFEGVTTGRQPQRALLVRKIREFALVRAIPDPSCLFETNWLLIGRIDFHDDDALSLAQAVLDRDAQPRIKHAGEPVHIGFTAHALSQDVDRGANYFMRVVRNAKDKVSAPLFRKDRAIGECADIFAEFFRIEAVLLEFEPIGLVIPGNERFDQFFDVQSQGKRISAGFCIALVAPRDRLRKAHIKYTKKQLVMKDRSGPFFVTRNAAHPGGAPISIDGRCLIDDNCSVYNTGYAV